MEPTNFPGNYNVPEDDYLDIKRYISLFISNWYWFAVAILLAMTIAYVKNRYSDKVFTVSSTLLIRDDQIGSMSSVESVIPGGDIFRNRQNLNNEIGILKSFRLNDTVMKKLEDFHVFYVGKGRRGIVESQMYKTCPFKVVYNSLKIQPKGLKVGIVILSDSTYRIEIDGDLNFKDEMSFGKRFFKYGLDFYVEPRYPGNKIFNINGSNNYYFYFVDPENLANQYRGKLSVAPIAKDASIVTLSVSGLDPVQEADYLNKLMDVYINYGLDYKTRTAELTIEFIDDQVRIISDSLLLAEKNMEKFRLSNNFIDLSSKGTLIQNKLEKIENEKNGFELQLHYYNYLSEYLNQKNAGGTIISPSVMGIADGLLITLVNEFSAMQKQKENLAFNLVGDQLVSEFMDKKAEETREALKENIRNGIANLKLLIVESNRKMSEVDTEINKLPTIERQLIRIQRKFDLNNTVYTYLLEKRAESGIARASNIPDNRIIDNASQFSSAQIKPKTRLNLTVALILGLIFPMAGIVLVDFFNDKVIDRKDIEKKTKVPVIGYISHSDGKSEIPVFEKPGSSLAESFRSVRTAVKYYIKENKKPVIVVSSTISSEGKTFISINLAVITAMLGKKVLLVGLDLRKPRINKVLEFDDSPGMSAYLSGNCEYKEIIKSTQINNLFYAPSGAIPPNPAELIETDNMRIFISKAKKEFDFIIIDTPPVAIVTDTLLLAPYVDLNLFIVRQRFTSRNTLEMIEQLHKKGDLKNLAIIINDISLSGYYGYGLRYGYSLGYGYSYGYNYYGKGYYRRYGYTDGAKGYYTEE
jgi:capsular exopolysaccharide synthesis family protein